MHYSLLNLSSEPNGMEDDESGRKVTGREERP